MTDLDPTRPLDIELTVADILGDAFETPFELSEALTENQIRDRIAQLHEQRATVDTEIALLQSKRKRLRSQTFLAQDALRIALDKGLE